MTGQPLATAGPTWCTMRFSGWLKALTATTTPRGSRRVNATRPMVAGVVPTGITSPEFARSASMHRRTPSMARITSTFESV